MRGPPLGDREKPAAHATARKVAASLPDRHRRWDRHFEFEAASGVYAELQCGSYIFMDAGYGRNLDRDGAPTKAFEPCLCVLARVMSRPVLQQRISTLRFGIVLVGAPSNRMQDLTWPLRRINTPVAEWH